MWKVALVPFGARSVELFEVMPPRVLAVFSVFWCTALWIPSIRISGHHEQSLVPLPPWAEPSFLKTFSGSAIETQKWLILRLSVGRITCWPWGHFENKNIKHWELLLWPKAPNTRKIHQPKLVNPIPSTQEENVRNQWPCISFLHYLVRHHKNPLW